MNKIISINTTTIPKRIELITKKGDKVFIYGNKVLRLYKRRSDAKRKQKDNERIYYDAYKKGWYLSESSIEDAKKQQEKEMEKINGKRI